MTLVSEREEKKEKKKLLNFDAKADNFVNNYVFYVLLAAFSFIFCLLFCYCTSPLAVGHASDGGFFMAVGQGMTKGLLPYRDYFDMKGPYLFLIQYAGQAISYGRWGIFIVEWLNFTLSMILISKAFEISGIKNHRLILLLFIPVVYILLGSMGGGNLTEEYSLVPIFLCLLLYLKYFYKTESADEKEHSPLYGAVYGFCFGFLALIRITNAALICAIVLCVCVDLIINGKWKNLFVNGAAFILGAAAAFAPMLVYYAGKGMLADMLYTVFVFGFKYSSEKGLAEHFIEMFATPHHILIGLVPILTVLCDKNRNYRKVLFAVVCSTASLAAVCTGNNYYHYYTLVVPVIVYGEVLLVNDIFKENKKRDKRQIIAAALICLVALAQSERTMAIAYHSFEFIRDRGNDYITQSCDLAEHIPDEDKDSIFGYGIDPCWYAYTDNVPCIKYCGWQNHYIALVPEIEQEMTDTFSSNPPKWLIMEESMIWDKMPEFIKESLKEKYTEVYSNNTFLLFEYAKK